MLKTLEVNSIGPIMLTQALEPLLKSKNRPVASMTSSSPEGRPPSVVASLSARVGSINDNRLGGWYSYRVSKAALNMATKNMALELKRSGILVVSLHPGTTETGLSEPFAKNVRPEKLFSPSFTVSQLLGVIGGLDERHTGGFYAWDGQPIEW